MKRSFAKNKKLASWYASKKESLDHISPKTLFNLFERGLCEEKNICLKREQEKIGVENLTTKQKKIKILSLKKQSVLFCRIIFWFYKETFFFAEEALYKASKTSFSRLKLNFSSLKKCYFLY